MIKINNAPRSMLQIFAANSANISRTSSPSRTFIYLSISLARYIVLCIVLGGTRRLCNHISGSLTQHFQLKLTFMCAPLCVSVCVCVRVCRVWLANIPYKFTAFESGFCHFWLLSLTPSLSLSLFLSYYASLPLPLSLFLLIPLALLHAFQLLCGRLGLH